MTPTSEDIALVLQAALRGVDPRNQGWQVQYLEALEGIFEDDGNPTLPWEAWRWARHHRLPVPAWVLAYLDDCVRRMRTGLMANEFSETEAVGRALGFGSTVGVSQPAARRVQRQRAVMLAFEFATEEALARENYPGRPPKRSASVAAIRSRHPDVSETTVGRAIRDHSEAGERALRLVREMFLHE